MVSSYAGRVWGRQGRVSAIAILLVVVLGASLGGALPMPRVLADSHEEASLRAVLVPVADGLDFPVFVSGAGDGTGRLFVAEKAGRIQLIPPDGPVQDEPFLDITDRVKSNRLEQGLLGLAFHPDYADNGRFYVNYTRLPDGATVISEFVGAGNTADKDSERAVLVISQPGVGHNAGMIAFDAAGLLVASMSDGAYEKPIRADAQDPELLYGKLVALDVDSGEPYEVDAEGRLMPGSPEPQILASGLRNAWRFSIDRELGHFYIGDVGNTRWEEISVLPAGSGMLDFGWEEMEGPQCGPAATCLPGSYTAPVITYPHDPGGSVVGGYAYRGSSEPLLDGLYIFGDWSFADIRAVPVDEMLAGAAVPFELHPRIPAGVASFGEDDDGEVYVVTTSGVARISAELYTGPGEPEPPELPDYPVIVARPYDISELVFRPAGPVFEAPVAPQILDSNDAVLVEGPGNCITVEPTFTDPFVTMPVPTGFGVRLEPGSDGILQVFLQNSGLVSEDQSVRIDVTSMPYDILAPRNPSGAATVLRVDPPVGEPSIVCLVTITE